MKKFLSNLIIIIFVIVIILVIISCIWNQNHKTAPFCGIGIYKVLSNSMNPHLYKNDFVIVKKEKSYNINDIITYISSDNCLITHRIIEKYKNGFITKGDNNNIADIEEVYLESIVGRVIYIIKN